MKGRKQMQMQWTLADLVFLHDLRIAVDIQTFAAARDAENTHRDFASCSGCGAQTFTQHDPTCPRASILWEPLWYEMLKDQDLIYYGVLAIVRLREQFWRFE
jgi:hypothetical protein